MKIEAMLVNLLEGRGTRRSHWPKGKRLVYSEGATPSAGPLEGCMVGPQLFLQEDLLLITWHPTLDDLLAINWEIASS